MATEPQSSTSLAARLRSWLGRWSAALRIGLSAVAVWVITPAPVAGASRAGVLDRLLCALGLLVGLAAPVMARRSQRLARHLGLSAFSVLALGAWLSAALGPGLPRFDGYRAVLGALAWGLYALSWSHPWGRPEGEMRSVEPRPASPLEPRRRLPRSTTLIAAVGVVSALSCLGLGWRVYDPDRAVLGHTLAVAAAIGLLGAASSLALVSGQLPEHEPTNGRGRAGGLPRAFFRSLVALLVLALAAAALALSRS
jgi:hypothetical protein